MTTSRLVRVFISSTFRDFMGERDELVKRIFPELRRRCKARFVELLEVDLRWGITEEQSKSGETLRICLQEIDRCRPSAPVFFIGMLGERYGWIPPEDYYPKSVTEDPELGWVKQHVGGKSVTELEILHGVLNNNVMRDKAFFYFRNDGYEKRHWPEIAEHHEGIVPPLTPGDFTNAKSENPAADEAKQQQLKKDICDASLAWDPRPYETPEELGKMVFQDLADAIDRIFPEDSVPGELERLALEHESFGESRARGYVPRPGLFEGLDWILEQSAPSVRVVTGESGGGKSALFAAWLRKNVGQLPPRTFVHYIGGTPESSTARSIVMRLMETIRSWGAVKERVPDDFGEAVQLLPEWLNIAAEAQDRGVLIVLDALNQLESAHDQTLWWLPKELPSGVRLLVSTLPGPAEEELKSRGWMEDALFVPALREEEKALIISSYLSLFSRTLEQKHVTRLMGAPQTANPLFLKVVLDELRIRGRYEVLGDMISRMLEAKDPVELFKQVLKNLEEYDKERPNLVRDALGYLAAARRGLTESELLQLLSSAENPSIEPLPRSIWSPLYLALEESLVSRDGRLGFFHDFLRQAVEQEYLDEESEVRKIHMRFGDVASSWKMDTFSPSLKEYGLAFGAWHLRRANDMNKLWSLLSNEKYLNEQINAFGSCDYAENGLTEGVIAYAEGGGTELDSDIRLAWLASTRSNVRENEQFNSLPKAIEEFARTRSCNITDIKSILKRINILQSDEHYFASQIIIILIIISKRINDKSLSSLEFEIIIRLCEEKAYSYENVETLSGLEDYIYKQDIKLIKRFAALSINGDRLILRCAENNFQEGSYLLASRLNYNLLLSAVDILLEEDKKTEAIDLVGELLSSWCKEDSDAGRLLEVCLKSIAQISNKFLSKKIIRLINICRKYTNVLKNHAWNKREWDSSIVSCMSLTDILSYKLNLKNSNDSKSALAFARTLDPVFIPADKSSYEMCFSSKNETEQRTAAVIEICCSLIEVGRIQDALQELDSELEIFAEHTIPGSATCDFVLNQSDGLGKIINACADNYRTNLLMSRIVDIIYDEKQFNSNGLYTGMFTNTLSEVLRKIYSRNSPNHKFWIPDIVDIILKKRPNLDFGEVGSIAAAGLADLASAIGLSENKEKSIFLHKTALSEAIEVYKKSGLQYFNECAQSAIRSSQIKQADQYITTFNELRLQKGETDDHHYINYVKTLLDNHYINKARDLIILKAYKKDITTSLKWSVNASRLILLYCQESRFIEAFKILEVITLSREDVIELIAMACVCATKEQNWDLLDALWSKAESPQHLALLFLPSWRSVDSRNLKTRDALKVRFENHWLRIQGRSDGGGFSVSPEEQIIYSQALARIGKTTEAISTVTRAYLLACSRNSSRLKQEAKKTISHLVGKLTESIGGKSSRNGTDYHTGDWNDTHLNDLCFAHLCSCSYSEKYMPLAWSFLLKIKNRRIALNSFNVICENLAEASCQVRAEFLEDVVIPFLQILSDNIEISQINYGIKIKSPDDLSLTDSICAALASISKLISNRKKINLIKNIDEEALFDKKTEKIINDLITIIRPGMSPVNNFYNTFKSIEKILKTNRSDLALELMIESLDYVSSLKGSVDRETAIVSIFNIIPLFLDNKNRRMLISKAVKLLRKMWRSDATINQWIPENIISVITNCAISGETKLAIKLVNTTSYIICDQQIVDDVKAKIAFEVANQGDVLCAEKLLLTLPNKYRYTQAWSTIARQQMLLGNDKKANGIYKKIIGAIYSSNESQYLSEDFIPILNSFENIENLAPFKELIIDIKNHPIMSDLLWDSLFKIFSNKCFSATEKSQLLDRFLEKSLLEHYYNNSELIPEKVLISLSNIAIKNSNSPLKWITNIKNHTSCISLYLGKVDFDNRLLWIRAFFSLCSASPAITKMQVTALIAAHGLQGNFLAVRMITRNLPQPDLWQSYTGAVVAMIKNARSRAKSLEERDKSDEANKVLLSALEVSSEIVGPGHSSVVKLAESISKWHSCNQELTYYRAALINSEELYSKNDARTLTLMSRLALLLAAQKEYREALELFQSCYHGRILIFGEGSEDTLSALFNIASMEEKVGDRTKALNHFKVVLEGRLELFTEDDPRVLRCIDKMSRLQASLGQWSDAETSLRRAIYLKTKQLESTKTKKLENSLSGQSDVNRGRRDLFINIVRLSIACLRQRNYSEAILISEEAIERLQEILSEISADSLGASEIRNWINVAHSVIVDSCDGLGDNSRAIELQKRIVEEIKSQKGEECEPYFNAISKLGVMLFKMDRFNDAEPLYRNLVKASSHILGRTHGVTIDSLKGCSVILRKLGKATEALEMLRKAYGQSEPSMKELRPALLRLECLAGDHQKALRLAKEEVFEPEKRDDARIARWLSDPDFEPIHDYLRSL